MAKSSIAFDGIMYYSPKTNFYAGIMLVKSEFTLIMRFCPERKWTEAENTSVAKVAPAAIWDSKKDAYTLALGANLTTADLQGRQVLSRLWGPIQKADCSYRTSKGVLVNFRYNSTTRSVSAVLDQRIIKKYFTALLNNSTLARSGTIDGVTIDLVLTPDAQRNWVKTIEQFAGLYPA